jgi:hypothetical protein
MTPTVRARVVEAAPAYRGARGYEMEWAEDESTTTTWSHESAQPALQYAASFLNSEPAPRSARSDQFPSARSDQFASARSDQFPSARSDQVQVVRYEVPPPPAPMPAPVPMQSFHVQATPRPRFVPPPRIDDEFEPAIGTERALGAVVWTVLSAAGLFCAVLFMHLIVSDGTNDARKSAELAPASAPSAPIAAAAAPSAPAPQVQEVAAQDATKPEPAAPQPAAAVATAPVVEPKQTSKLTAPKAAPARQTKHTQRAPKPAPAKHVARPAPQPAKQTVRVEQAPAPAAHAMGTLRVNSLPWSQVFVDGKLVGNTPQMGLPLPAGHHKLKLVNEPLEMTKVFSVQIQPGQVVTKTVNLSQ